MKKLLILCCVLCFIASCKKNDLKTADNRDVDLLEAKDYFSKSLLPNATFNQANPRTQTSKSPQWDKAAMLHLSRGQAVVVPLQYSKKLYLRSSVFNKLFEVSQLAQLLIYEDSMGTLHGEVITAFPDSAYLVSPGARFTGLLFVEDWQGNRLKEYKYDAAGTRVFHQGGQPGGKTEIENIIPNSIVATCYEIDGYNYSEDDPANGVFWSEPGGCDYQFLPDQKADGSGASGGDYGTVAGGAAGPAPAPNFFLFSGTSPIANIQQTIKCFTNSTAPDHMYTVTVCVDQPIPGSRSPWNFSGGGSSATGSPVNVGHTFLIFNETYGGMSVIRNIGFYPKDEVSPRFPTDQGQLNDDQNHAFNVSSVFTVSSTQFFQILNYTTLGNNAGFSYDLNINNCSTFAIRAMGAGGVILPSTIGTWPNGSGNDPGDLGQDLLSMLPKTGVSTSIIQGTHPDIGFCN